MADDKTAVANPDANVDQDVSTQTPATPEPRTDAPERFLDSAKEGFTGAIKGAVGMGKEIIAPKGKTEKERLSHIVKTIVTDPADEMAREASTTTNPAESIGYSVAEALPVVGPFVAGVAKKMGTQAGAGDYAGAAGTAVGNLAAAKVGEEVAKPLKGKEAPAATGGEVPDHIAFDKSAGGKELPQSEALRAAKDKRGPTTFGRTPGTKFGDTVDQTFDILRQNETPAPPGGKVEAPEIKSEGPEWDRVHSATVDGKKVGSVGYHLDPEGEAQIYGSNVSADMRRKGIGQKLYTSVIEDARNAGASRITSDSTNLTPDAARVWEKLRAKGLPVEDIVHTNGKPGYQIDFENQQEPGAPPAETPEPQHVPTLARRGQLPGQTVNLNDAYGDTGGYVGGHLEYNGYPKGSTPEQIRQRYVENLGVTRGTDLMDIPQDRLADNTDKQGTITHELGHVVVAHLMGIPTEGAEIQSHMHPSVAQSGAAAATQLDWSQLPGATKTAKGSFFTPDGLKEAFPKLLNTLLGGGVAQELVHGQPIDTNEGMNGDMREVQRLGKLMGFTPEEMKGRVESGIEQTRALLNHPEILDTIKSNSAEREEGLSKTLHMSAGKVQDVVRQIKENQNGRTDNSNTRAVVDTGLGAGANRGTREADAGGAGKVQAGASVGNGPKSSLEASKVAEPVEEHPTVTALKAKYGSSTDPAAMTNGGASFLHSDGTVTSIGSTDHPAAISMATGGGPKGGGKVDRVEFINDTGSIRVRNRPQAKAGPEIVFSVPEKGVTPEQVDMMKQAVGKMGRNGNLLIEPAREGNEVSDTPTSWGTNDVKTFATPRDVEPMLKNIGAHPDQAGEVPSTLEANKGEKPWSEKAADMAKAQGGGFTIDPRTGESPKTGFQVEFSPEQREVLDHPATAKDIQDFYDKNKATFDAHPELHVGGFENELNISANAENQKAAENTAKKLGQRSIWDVTKGEEIQTKGTGERTEFPNYPPEDRMKDLKGEPQSNIPGFEGLSKDVHDHLEPDERGYLLGNKLLQKNVMKRYHSISPSVPETTNAMQAGAALGGWWQRYIDVFHNLTNDGSEAAANTIGPSHTEVLKQWHAALSGNKSVQDANNLAWHSYADWLDAGKPTDRTSINDIIKKNAAQPEGSGKRGNAAISDTMNAKGKILAKGLDTNKLFNLVNSPEMKGERPFTGDAFSDDTTKNPLMGTTEGARKIPSMGATVAGKGNLNRLVIDAHIRDFFGRTTHGGPAAQYIADSTHLRQAAEALGLRGGEGQEQLWGTVLGLKTLLKQGLTPAEAGSKLNSEVINNIGKDYAEVIANDPEITQPGGILDRLKDKYGIGRGAAGAGEAYSKASGTGAGETQPAGRETGTDKTQLTKTASRILGTISESKIKTPGAEDESFNFGSNVKPKAAKKSAGKPQFSALSFLSAISGLNKPGGK